MTGDRSTLATPHKGVPKMAEGGCIGEGCGRDRDPRIIPAGAWIRVQDGCMWAAGIILGLGVLGTAGYLLFTGPDAAQDVWWLSAFNAVLFVLLSWGLEEPRMNGLPYEQRLAKWLETR